MTTVMSDKDLIRFANFMFARMEARNPVNAYGGQKDAFRRWSQAFLRRVAADCGMTPQDHRVSFNPGGPAVSGDATLHHVKVYVSFNCDCMCTWILYRSCEGMKDYSGGYNRQQYWLDLTTMDGYQRFIDKIKEIING